MNVILSTNQSRISRSPRAHRPAQLVREQMRASAISHGNVKAKPKTEIKAQDSRTHGSHRHQYLSEARPPGAAQDPEGRQAITDEIELLAAITDSRAAGGLHEVRQNGGGENARPARNAGRRGHHHDVPQRERGGSDGQATG